MQISSNHNLAIIAGLPRQDQTLQGPAQRQAPPAPASPVVAGVQAAAVPGNTGPVRPAVNPQPMFDQALTYRGEQARRAYQDVALSGDVELLQRLDVKA